MKRLVAIIALISVGLLIGNKAINAVKSIQDKQAAQLEQVFGK